MGAGGWGAGAFDEPEGVVETGGVAEEGRDQPGPVVVDSGAVDVSFAVTSFEWEVEGWGAGRAAGKT